MRLIANGTQVSTPDTPAAVIGTPGYGTDGNIVNGPLASIFDNDTCNSILLELMAPLMALGTAADPNNNAQHLAALRTIFGAQLQIAGTTGTMTVPPGKTQALVFLWGGGAGGGGTYGPNSGASGGAAGEFRLALVKGLTQGQVIPVSIGAVASGGQPTNPPTQGTAGSPSSFGPYITCAGGAGGAPANANALATTPSSPGAGAWGTGVAGLVILGDGGGLPAQVASGGGIYGGTGGGTFAAAPTAPNLSAPGFAGHFPGGGGAGGAQGGNGGNGQGGLCIALFI